MWLRTLFVVHTDAHNVTIPIDSKGRLYEWNWTKHWKIKYIWRIVYVYLCGVCWFGLFDPVFASKQTNTNEVLEKATYWCVCVCVCIFEYIWRKPESFHFECSALLLVAEGARTYISITKHQTLPRRIGKGNCSNSHLFVVWLFLFGVAENVDGSFVAHVRLIYVNAYSGMQFNLSQCWILCNQNRLGFPPLQWRNEYHKKKSVSIWIIFGSICAWSAYGETKKEKTRTDLFWRIV